jgi:hypothetical protein
MKISARQSSRDPSPDASGCACDDGDGPFDGGDGWLLFSMLSLS